MSMLMRLVARLKSIFYVSHFQCLDVGCEPGFNHAAHHPGLLIYPTPSGCTENQWIIPHEPVSKFITSLLSAQLAGYFSFLLIWL